MKTSFYFVLWMAIYPLLGLFHSRAVDENSFVLALIIVWGLSWALNRLMPKTLAYERISEMAPVMEDVYTGNVASFSKRLTRETIIEAVTGVYFCVATFAIAMSVFKVGMSDWMALAIFAFFTFGVVSRSIKLGKAKSALSANPTPEQCAEIAQDTYRLNYAAYYAARKDASYQAMLPPRPRHYKAFQAVSLVFAIISALLGLVYIVLGAVSMIGGHSMTFAAFASMTFLYGSLAACFGIKDIISVIRVFRT